MPQGWQAALLPPLQQQPGPMGRPPTAGTEAPPEVPMGILTESNGRHLRLKKRIAAGASSTVKQGSSRRRLTGKKRTAHGGASSVTGSLSGAEAAQRRPAASHQAPGGPNKAARPKSRSAGLR
eukprot:scaffold107446_cov48-Prasinocladus_malaysianus.AAC.1